MNSIRRWFNRPKKNDNSLLAQFFFSDEELNLVAAELDSFDGRKDPERCTILVNKLRSCQDKVLVVIQKIIDEAIGPFKANRDFRVKFPDDVLQENLAGQLWFGAECLAAGSSIMNREIESASMRPLARALTKNLDSLRTLLREQCLSNQTAYTERIRESLIIFDKLFAEFELSYVSTMVPVKTMKEYDLTQEITVLFSETVQRALKKGLIDKDMIDDYDPALMFTIPRLAIICGLLIFPEGPLNPDLEPSNISEMFRPFQTLLQKIRELLCTLSEKELATLENALCSTDEPQKLIQTPAQGDESSQTDPGFEDGGEPSTSGSVSMLCLNLEDMDKTAVSQSASIDTLVDPLTPVPISHNASLPPMFPVPDEVEYSPTSTLIDSLEGHDSLNSSLNKSDSKDSGLHSENVSTSETVACEQSPVIASTDSVLGCTETSSSDGRHVDERTLPQSNNNFLCSETFSSDEEYCLCRGVVDELIDRVVNSDRRVPYNRQGSWQYNLNLEIPRISSSASLTPISSSSSSTSSSSECSVVACDSSYSQNCHNQSDSSLSTHNDQSDCRLNKKDSKNVCDMSSDTKHSLDSNVDSSCDSFPPDHNHKDTNVISSPSANNTESETKDSSVHQSPCKKDANSHSEEAGNKQENTAEHPRIQRLRYSTDSVSSSFSSCHSTTYDQEWDKESDESCETSSYNSESNDDEEIALAIQAAEIASRKEARSRFRSSSDLIHRLFVCISGVADQLQTNYAGDLRNILKCVFDMNCSDPVILLDENSKKRTFDRHPSFMSRRTNRYGHRSSSYSRPREPPQWVPDEQMEKCMACEILFSFVRRRHHCRNCGKIFCGRCSANFVPLPHFGYTTPVRVCNHCFLFQVTPFTVNE